MFTALHLGGSRGAERLDDVTLSLDASQVCLLHGPAGSGKNLLLRYLGLLERPDSGEILLNGEPTRDWTDAERIEARSRRFGFVFETPLLLPAFNVAENIAMPLLKLTGASPAQAREATCRAVEHVGLSGMEQHSAESLPVWAQQRVAIARALVMRPEALFVENIDSLARDDELIALLELLAATRRRFGCCVVATAAHADLVRFADRAVEFNGGRVAGDRFL